MILKGGRKTGSRLTIYDETGELIYYGDKLYGYVENLRKSKGLRFLWVSAGVCEDEDFDTFEEFADFIDYMPSTGKICKLSIEQLSEFLLLYDEDAAMWEKKHTVSDKVIIPKDIKYVWLEWG